MLNELQPGALLTELSLAAELGGSQSSIREALLRLEGEGLVMRSGHQGTTVTNLEANEAAEILGLRRRIEARAARAVIRGMVAADVVRLEDSLRAMRAAAEARDLWAMVQADTKFHLDLFAVSALHAMRPILARCILHTHRFRLWAPWHQRPLVQTADRHEPILTALRDRNATALRRSIEEHLDTIVETRQA
jgi:hypothetical protein